MLLKLLRTLLPRPSPYSISIAKCSTSSPSLVSDSHEHIHPRNVSVTVFWDVDTCTVPPGVDPYTVSKAISAAINASGINGPLRIKAFADMSLLSKTIKWKLYYTGISFPEVPQGVYSADALSIGLNDWVSKNPPPAHLFLISANTMFAENLCRQRKERYNILLASTECSMLCSSATILWSWDALVRGENLTGRYLNQPPHDSWYDHYEGLLEDPSTATIERPVVRNMNWCNDSFWRDMKVLMDSEIGSFIISESSTRDHMAYYLQQYGPSVLTSVTESDVLLMVDRLITEKKLLVEIADLINPFKRTDEVEKAYAQINQLKNEDLTKQQREKKQEIDELNSKIENLQKIHEEQKSQIRKTEQALKVAEEEVMKAKFDATSN